MPPQAMQWLENKIPQFGNLDGQDKIEIQDFSLLWSFFEGTKLNTNANVGAIRQFVTNLSPPEIGQIDTETFVQYLQNRYYVDGNYTEHYQHLHLERNHNYGEVEEMLTQNDATKEVQIVGCLIIIYRYRNNLFHGEKWRYHLADQRTNFEASNNFLIMLMD